MEVVLQTLDRQTMTRPTLDTINIRSNKHKTQETLFMFHIMLCVMFVIFRVCRVTCLVFVLSSDCLSMVCYTTVVGCFNNLKNQINLYISYL